MTTREFPEGTELTHILVVGDVDRSRDFYRDVVGAEVVREYGGTSAVLRLSGTWLLLVTGGGPSDDKPTVTFTAPGDPDAVSHAMTFRVADCRAAYQTLVARGAEFLTPPVDHGVEVRCFLRDPDGHLLELSQAG
ncbi:VOC family protein [Streptomyces sp. NBC_01216]|uniref:VOC family protein n=1 Tax=unclassified Streptomyces TaxID=2593676 RepID=UPI002E10DD98|nr:VOC family protein [Streptomyces sp. NBC_01216]